MLLRFKNRSVIIISIISIISIIQWWITN